VVRPAIRIGLLRIALLINALAVFRVVEPTALISEEELGKCRSIRDGKTKYILDHSL
jgi:hypothetical protein